MSSYFQTKSAENLSRYFHNTPSSPDPKSNSELMHDYWSKAKDASGNVTCKELQELHKEVEKRALTMLKTFGHALLSDIQTRIDDHSFQNIIDWKTDAKEARQKKEITTEVIRRLKKNGLACPNTHFYKELTYDELDNLYIWRRKFHNTFSVLAQVAINCNFARQLDPHIRLELQSYQTADPAQANSGCSIVRLVEHSKRSQNALAKFITGCIEKHLLCQKHPPTPVQPPAIDDIVIMFYHFLEGYHTSRHTPVSFASMVIYLREELDIPLKKISQKQTKWHSDLVDGDSIGPFQLGKEIAFRSTTTTRYFSEQQQTGYTIACHGKLTSKADKASPIFAKAIEYDDTFGYWTRIKKIAPIESLSSDNIPQLAHFIKRCAKQKKTPLDIDLDHLCWETDNKRQRHICSLFQELNEGFDYDAFEMAIPSLTSHIPNSEEMLFQQSGMRSPETVALFHEAVKSALKSNFFLKTNSLFSDKAKMIKKEVQAVRHKCNQRIELQYERKYHEQMFAQVPEKVENHYFECFRNKKYKSKTSSIIETTAKTIVATIFKEINKWTHHYPT